MDVATYFRPSTLLWYFFVILARLRDDIVSLMRLFIIRLPLSYFWGKSNNLVLYIHNATRDLSKLPKHISFIVMEDEVDIATISEAIVWCIILGISCISIADKQGLLSRHKQQLDRLVTTRLAQLNLPIKASIYQPLIDHHSNGIDESNNPTVSVAILSPSAGRRLLATAAVSLARTSSSQRTAQLATLAEADPAVDHYCEVSVQCLDQALRELSGLTDADLAYRLGATDSLFLPSPWHFRLAEFFQVSTQRVLTPEVFVDGLRFYSRVDQRLGK